MTMVPIATRTINDASQSVSQIAFTAIPPIYDHLKIFVSARTQNAGNFDILYAYNYDGSGTSTSSAYHTTYTTGISVGGSGSTTNFSSVHGWLPASNVAANIFGSVIIDILDYSKTTKNKATRSLYGHDQNSSTGDVLAGMASNLPVALGTSPITAITFVTNAVMLPGTRFDLYGITASGSTGV